MGGPFRFLCEKLSEFRFRRKANEIRKPRAGRNSFGAYSYSQSPQAPLADLARRRPPLLASCSNRLARN
jgi:hypothetical protein